MVEPVTFEEIRRKARQGHHEWVFWTGRDGASHAERYGADAIKSAMLSAGTRGRWYVIGANGVSHIVRSWRMGTLMFRNTIS